jgi:ABC-type transport system substrate-binding protein
MAIRVIVWWATVLLAATACSADEPGSTPIDVTSTSTTLGPPTSADVTSTSGDPGAVSTTTSDAPDTGPRRGGSAVVGVDFVPTNLNELRPGAAFSSSQWIRQLVRPAGYVVEPDGTLVPHLVSRDPSFVDGTLFLAEDGSLEVTWTIDSAARWSDGERVVAADFALAQEVACQGVDGVGIGVEFLDADPGQVRVRFAEPTAAFREAVAHVVPSHRVDRDLLCFDDGLTWPGTGPFVIGAVAGPMMELVRNPEYWRRDPSSGERLPYLDSISLREIPDDPSGLLATASVDIVEGSRFVGIGALTLPDGVVLQQGAGPVWEFITFQFGPDNRNEGSLNRHLEFRQALIHALDRGALADSAGWVLSHGLGGVGSSGPWAQYDHDPAEATALLEDLCTELERDCVTDPPRVVFTTTSNAAERPGIAELLAGMWGDVGVDVELQLEDSSLFFGESAPQGTYDVGMWAWLVGPDDLAKVDVLGTFDPADPGPEGRNWYRWGAPDAADSGGGVDEVAEVLAQLGASVEAATISDLLQEAEQILADQVVVIPIATRPVVVVHSLTLAGPEASAAPGGLLWNAELWFRTDG